MRCISAVTVLTVALAGIAGCGGPEAPKTTAMRGVLLVGLDGFGEDGDPCDLPAGFSDITSGGSVTVTGPAGKVVGVGRLGQGVRRNSAGYRVGSCELSVAADVPAGLKFYGVAVGHRNAVQFDEAHLGQVVITLG